MADTTAPIETPTAVPAVDAVAITPAPDAAIQDVAVPPKEPVNDTPPTVEAPTKDVEVMPAEKADASAVSDEEKLLNAIRDASPAITSGDSAMPPTVGNGSTQDNDMTGGRWRSCRCHARQSVPITKASSKSNADLSTAERDDTRDIPWPFVVLMVALAGALVLAALLHNPIVVGHVASSANTSFVGTTSVMPETGSTHPPKYDAKDNAVVEAFTADGADQKLADCDHHDVDQNADDNAWCACLCQPKGPLLNGRIVGDQCTCDCPAPTSRPLVASATVHPYAMSIVAIAQMSSLLIMAVALGCVLAPQ